MIDKLQVPPQLAWDATIILWCKITDYSDVMVNFKAAMVHLMVAASQEIGLTISTSLALACTIAQSIDQYEEQSAQSTPQIDVGKSSFSTVPPAGLQFYGSAGQLEAPYFVGDVNVTPEILSGPPVGVKWYMDDVDSVHKEIETSVCDTSMCPSQFRDLEKYSILVGLFIFGDDPGNIVQLLTGRSAEEVRLHDKYDF